MPPIAWATLVALAACAISPTPASDVSGQWTAASSAPLSQLITGLDIEQQRSTLTGRLFLSGRALQGGGSVNGDAFTMTFPAGNGAFTVYGARISDRTLGVSLRLPSSAEHIEATLHRAR